MTAKRKKRKRPVQGAAARTSPQRIAAAVRHAQWCEDRAAGKSISAIARAAKVAKSTVSEAITNTLRELPAEAREVVRVMENERLDHALSRVWPLLDDPDQVLGAVDRLVKLSKRRSELNGLDEAAQAPIGPDGKPVVPTIVVNYVTEPTQAEA